MVLPLVAKFYTKGRHTFEKLVCKSQTKELLVVIFGNEQDGRKKMEWNSNHQAETLLNWSGVKVKENKTRVSCRGRMEVE